ncbi:hypothetical protein THAOC_31889, partial [Thalassiosira oceanica]
ARAAATATRTGSGLPARAGPPGDDRLLDDRARPDILSIRSEGEYADFLGSEADDRICVIKFYASWCKSCAKFGVKYKRLARERGDVAVADEIVRAGEARFAEVEYTANARLCKSLKVKRLPSVHFHVRGEGEGLGGGHEAVAVRHGREGAGEAAGKAREGEGGKGGATSTARWRRGTDLGRRADGSNEERHRGGEARQDLTSVLIIGE